jgi:hypothetical protein
MFLQKVKHKELSYNLCNLSQLKYFLSQNLAAYFFGRYKLQFFFVCDTHIVKLF